MDTESYIGLYRTTGECVLTHYGKNNAHGGKNTHYGKDKCIVYVIFTRTITDPWCGGHLGIFPVSVIYIDLRNLFLS